MEERDKDKQKEWYQKNKERINAKAKKHYADNKDKLKKESLEIIQCPLCATAIRRSSLSHHKKTQKCKHLRDIRVATCQEKLLKVSTIKNY